MKLILAAIFSVIIFVLPVSWTAANYDYAEKEYYFYPDHHYEQQKQQGNPWSIAAAAGLPAALAIGYGVYWLVERRRKLAAPRRKKRHRVAADLRLPPRKINKRRPLRA